MKNKISLKLKEITEKFNNSDICKNSKCIQEKWNTKVNIIAKWLHKNSITANMITIFGFIIGMMSINFLAMNMYLEALIFILINRFCDVLDGAVARIEGITKFGVFLDLCLDFVFYAGVIFGFALADPYENAVSACFLLFGFTASSSALLAYGLINYNSSKKANTQKLESPFYLGGLAQGFETVCAFVLLCIMPFAFLPIAIALGCWCFLKALIIVSTAYYKLVINEQKSK
ncbi:MAG: CDP-alcohol phosphatidyltransferase family protein [Alphaproteobacteria bacterium]|nr:CDP-alcohol phosphatidyltransferase family protein [Alphaproteobacteria bacterium]